MRYWEMIEMPCTRCYDAFMEYCLTRTEPPLFHRAQTGGIRYDETEDTKKWLGDNAPKPTKCFYIPGYDYTDYLCKDHFQEVANSVLAEFDKV